MDVALLALNGRWKSRPVVAVGTRMHKASATCRARCVQLFALVLPPRPRPNARAHPERQLHACVTRTQDARCAMLDGGLANLKGPFSLFCRTARLFGPPLLGLRHCSPPLADKYTDDEFEYRVRVVWVWVWPVGCSQRVLPPA